MSAPFRRILANLDCECDFAARGSGRRAPLSRAALSRAALDTAASLGTLLRALAGDGDRLWTPAPVDPERLSEVPGLPRPVLESGPLAALSRPRAILAWGETPAAAAQRSTAQRSTAQPSAAPAPLHELLWRLPAADPAAVAALHHRAFALATSRRLGLALPGARMLASTCELDDHLRALAGKVPGAEVGTVLARAQVKVPDAEPSGPGPWVVKAPFSAAGRFRHVVHGLPTAADRRRLDRLFSRHGSLLFEPWLERVEDFGLAAIAGRRGARVVGFHRSFVGRRGAFQGLALDARFAGLRELGRHARRQLEETAGHIGRALAARGYRGPFGIDCWRYRRASGEIAWNPLGEINVRMTLGLVARALVDRVREPLGIDKSAEVRLGWGRGAPPPRAVKLLAAGVDRQALKVWLAADPPARLQGGS